MSHPLYHARSSAKKFGGDYTAFLPLHSWFDEPKAHLPDWRQRAIRHHAQGIFWAEEVFGVTIKNSLGQDIPVRILGEQHVLEDMGCIPTLADWFQGMPIEPWMGKRAKKLSKNKTLNETTD